MKNNSDTAAIQKNTQALDNPLSGSEGGEHEATGEADGWRHVEDNAPALPSIEYIPSDVDSDEPRNGTSRIHQT